MNKPRSPRFYFALPRLLAQLRHGDSSRAEINSGEAWAGSIGIFVVTYLFVAGLAPGDLGRWLTALIFLLLPIPVLVSWLIILWVNAQILKLLRACGLLRALPQRRGQAVLVGIATTAMAAAMAQRGSVSGELASIWLVAVGLNLTAAVVLAVRNANPIRS